jgi:hypothetical protein
LAARANQRIVEAIERGQGVGELLAHGSEQVAAGLELSRDTIGEPRTESCGVRRAGGREAWQQVLDGHTQGLTM